MLFKSIADAEQALAIVWRWPNFSVAELSCRCTGQYCNGHYWHAPTMLDGLQYIRAQVGRPLSINSGHRCAQWNAAVGGAPLSQHRTLAADISLRGLDRHAVLSAAKAFGFTGLGLARTFLHVDLRQRPANWFYKGSEALWQTS